MNARVPDVSHSGDLPLLLAAPLSIRKGFARDEIRARFVKSDQPAFASYLAERSLLPLLGTRVLQIAPDLATEHFRERLETDLALTRRRSIAFEYGLRAALRALDGAGLRALPLKGTALAIAAHGDVALRPFHDIDVLVRRRDIPRAVQVLTALGYDTPTDVAWHHGLPILHYTLRPREHRGPPLELHWRVHWCEERFSEELVERSSVGEEGWRRPEPIYELAELLLFYARDGLYGLRLAADISGWWDRHGAELSRGALDAIAESHPSLRRSLTAALMSLDHNLRLPVRHLLSGRPDPSARRAVALADPLALSPPGVFESRLLLVDGLLSPGRHKIGFFRRYYFQPLDEVRKTYGLQSAPSFAVAARRLKHTVGGLLKGAPTIAALWWRSRKSCREPSLAEHRSFDVVQRARLSLEVVLTYIHVRWLMRRHKLPEVLARLRGRSWVASVAAPEFRLAFIAQRVLRLVPADTRCLMSSLVLLAMLEHRSMNSILVIGAQGGSEFHAHAWVERDGQALLWPGHEFGRLVEL